MFWKIQNTWSCHVLQITFSFDECSPSTPDKLTIPIVVTGTVKSAYYSYSCNRYFQVGFSNQRREPLKMMICPQFSIVQLDNSFVNVSIMNQERIATRIMLTQTITSEYFDYRDVCWFSVCLDLSSGFSTILVEVTTQCTCDCEVRKFDDSCMNNGHLVCGACHCIEVTFQSGSLFSCPYSSGFSLTLTVTLNINYNDNPHTDSDPNPWC